MNVLGLALLVSCATVVLTGCGPVPSGGAKMQGTKSMLKLEYPHPRKVEQTDVFHGVEVADPYRWMEDIHGKEAVAWVEAQNRVTKAFLDGIPARDRILSRIREVVNFSRVSEPDQAGGKFYQYVNSGLQDQPVLVESERPSGAGRVIIDPNLWPKEEARSLKATVFSPDGQKMAYSTSKAGSDWSEWRIRDLARNVDLDDLIQFTKTGTVFWTHDSKAIVYTRLPEPEAGKEFTEANVFQSVWLHRVGDDQAKDVMLYEDKSTPHIRPWGGLTEDGTYLVIYLFNQQKMGNSLLVRPLRGEGAGGVPVSPENATDPWIRLFPEYGSQWSMLGNDGDTFYFETNAQAPRGRVVAMDVRGPRAMELRELIPQREEPLDSVSLAGDRLIVRSFKDCQSVVELFKTDGTKLLDVALPGSGTVTGMNDRRELTTRFFTYTDAVTPASVFSIDTVTGKVDSVWQPTLARVNLAQFETKLEFFTNRDGLRIPMFVSHRKGLNRDGTNPLILYGYGGFNNATRSGFSASRLAWMEMGGVFVQTSLRGQGDYGEAWHMAANRINKQRTFDDFIGAAEWLIAQGYTSSRKLAIQGGSNGGLLVGACMNQRPDLFGACLPGVGVMDMLRFHKFTVGAGWIREYGTPDDPLEFQVLHAISPYHNLRPGVKYPATLVTTSDHDDRVVPSHSYKYTARLQECHRGDAPVLIRVQTKGGHGGSVRLSESLEQAADQYAFLVRVLEME